MKIIIVEGKAWEQLRSTFADFIHRIEQLIGNPPETETWLDNEARGDALYFELYEFLRGYPR